MYTRKGNQLFISDQVLLGTYVGYEFSIDFLDRMEAEEGYWWDILYCHYVLLPHGSDFLRAFSAM